jgi:hypothetical protein
LLLETLARITPVGKHLQRLPTSWVTQNAAFTCRRLLKGALKARRAVALEGDQT